MILRTWGAAVLRPYMTAVQFHCMPIEMFDGIRHEADEKMRGVEERKRDAWRRIPFEDVRADQWISYSLKTKTFFCPAKRTSLT